MSVFGSREDDPLLQNDPLAPASKGEASEKETEENSSNDEPSDDETPSNGKASDSEVTSADDPRSSEEKRGPIASDTERQESVFHSSIPGEGEGHAQFDTREDTHAIVRRTKEAQDGQLSRLNAAFQKGWHLERVELREDPSHDENAEDGTPPPEASLALAFILRRPGTD